ncbi:MAG: hypothetical protein OEQ18_06180, partial [Gammaproteobacteria bacterium]|nr:hypothetical protein [Gammaproteobacteria bacterium]
MNKPHVLGIGLCLILTAGPAVAQTTTPVTAQTIIHQLRQDAYVHPGAGFRRVQVGHDFDRVTQVWGAPTRRKSTLLSNTWEYRVVNDTRVILRGRAKVDSIEVIAGFNSELQSAEGVRFGMATYQVISIYGHPDQSTSNTLSYPRKGIEFGFASGGVRSIRVF